MEPLLFSSNSSSSSICGSSSHSNKCSYSNKAGMSKSKLCLSVDAQSLILHFKSRFCLDSNELAVPTSISHSACPIVSKQFNFSTLSRVLLEAIHTHQVHHKRKHNGGAKGNFERGLTRYSDGIGGNSVRTHTCGISHSEECFKEGQPLLYVAHFVQ